MRVLDLTPGIGAVVSGVDLRRLGPADVERLRRLFLDRKVLAFPGQHLFAEELLAFAGLWGRIDRQELADQVHPDLPDVQILEHDEVRPPLGYEWHTDLSWSACPPMATVLSARIIPPVGGDTVFCDMEAVFAGLSPRLQELLTGLSARHERVGRLLARGIDPARIAEFLERHPPLDHPVVRRHPETGRRCLYVNPSFTTRINGIEGDESRALLDLVFSRVTRPEVQCRLSWREGTVAIWDNRCLLHNAVADYHPAHRAMERVVIAGDRPAG